MTEEPRHTRDRIFGAAARLMAQKGFARVSMREIAAAAGVSKPMLYYYFQSKEGLLCALLDAGMSRLDALRRGLLAQDLSAGERLRQMVRNEFRHAAAQPELIRLFLEVIGDLDRYPEVAGFLRHRKTRDKAIEEFIRQAQAAGEWRRDVEAAVAADVFRGMVGYFLAQSARGAGLPLSDELADGVFAIFVEGMQARGAGCRGGAQPRGDRRPTKCVAVTTRRVTDGGRRC